MNDTIMDFNNNKRKRDPEDDCCDADTNKKKWTKLQLVNVVITASVGSVLDLHKLSVSLKNAEYFPRKFAALKLCRSNPFAKALVFRSGKIVCVGATTCELAHDSLNYFAEQIRTIEGEKIVLRERKIQNMVASTRLKDESACVNLIRLFENCPKNCQYEP